MSEKPQIWLPLTKTYKRGMKTTVLIIPGASHMDKSQLEDILQWQTEKIEKEPIQQPKAVMLSQDIKGALNDFLKYLKRKKSDDIKRFY